MTKLRDVEKAAHKLSKAAGEFTNLRFRTVHFSDKDLALLVRLLRAVTLANRRVAVDIDYIGEAIDLALNSNQPTVR